MGCAHCPSREERWHPEDVYRLLAFQHCVTVDTYPMPIVCDHIDRLGKAKFITASDLSCGYWQVPVCEDTCAKTAITTLFQLFQFCVMPLGLHGAP